MIATRAPSVVSCSFGNKGLRTYVRLQLPRVSNCWRQELFHAPTLAGSVTMHFTITNTGTLTAISVDGELPSDGVKQCIAKDLAHWQFPPTVDAARVNYPLTFTLAE